MKNLIESLEEVIDRHIKNPPKPSDDVVQITRNCIIHFENSEKAVFACLISLANFIKHTSEICNKLEDENLFLQIMSDPVIKMVLPFANQMLSCRRFK